MALDWVQRELREKLGLVPYPGTLNLRVDPAIREIIHARRHSLLRIEDEAAPECPGYLQKVSLQANERACSSAYLILPELTMYKDVVEIISEHPLREELGLKDGDWVRVAAVPEEGAPDPTADLPG